MEVMLGETPLPTIRVQCQKMEEDDGEDSANPSTEGYFDSYGDLKVHELMLQDAPRMHVRPSRFLASFRVLAWLRTMQARTLLAGFHRADPPLTLAPHTRSRASAFLRTSTLKVTQGQILSQSPTDATRFWWHLYGS